MSFAIVSSSPRKKQQAHLWAGTVMGCGPAHFGNVTAKAVQNESEVSEEPRRFSPGCWLGVGQAWRAVCALIGRTALPAGSALPGRPRWKAAPPPQHCNCRTAPRSPSCGESGHSGEAQPSEQTTSGPGGCSSTWWTADVIASSYCNGCN